jgi:enediyne biosynthesis protein E4
MKKIFIVIIIGIWLWAFIFQSRQKQINTALSSTSEDTTMIPAHTEPTNHAAPQFREVKSNYTHVHQDGGHIIAGGTLIDIDGNGVDEVFIGGGNNQADALMFFENDQFINKIPPELSSKSPTYGAYAIDFDRDWDSDLFTWREDGITYYENLGNNTWKSSKLDITFEKDTVPSSITGWDINNDGFLDLYVSVFISSAKMRSAVFNDANHAKTNMLLLNDGNNTFTNITQKSGAVFAQNTFLSSLIDLNNDDFEDIIVSPNTERVTIFKNNWDLTFTRLAPLTEYGFWMGLALGDIDNDGDADIFVTNMGNTIPVRAARGDLRKDQILDPEWRIFRNDGNFAFTDTTEGSGLLNHGFAWGAVFADFNLDTFLDLYVMENYIKWPLHKIKKLSGSFFTGSVSGKFVSTTAEAKVENFHFGMTPLVSDFNRDGSPDIFIINLDGPSRAFINTSAHNNSISINMGNNVDAIGARIILTLPGGEKLTRQFITSQWLLSTQSNTINIGIWNVRTVPNVDIFYSNWIRKTFQNIENGTLLKP